MNTNSDLSSRSSKVRSTPVVPLFISYLSVIDICLMICEKVPNAGLNIAISANIKIYLFIHHIHIYKDNQRGTQVVKLSPTPKPSCVSGGGGVEQQQLCFVIRVESNCERIPSSFIVRVNSNSNFFRVEN